jgi:hypothetical protein
MNDEPKTEAPKSKPKKAERVVLEHPKMKGNARVWEKDLAPWLGKGWQRVKSAGNAD